MIIPCADCGGQSEGQAAEDSAFYEIELEMAPIWSERKDARWLYVEQAMAGHKDRPYRQRVYRLGRLDSGRFESAVFRLPGEKRFIGAWTDPARLGALTPDP